jgi:large subunit ribosomal protein L9
MATTTILLREDIDNLGGRGEVVKVKSGYARNYLLPKGIATLATKGNVKQIDRERESLLKRAATEKSTAEAQAEQMRGISLAFERKAGKDGTLFGSVTSMDIAEALQARGYEIDRRKINLKDTIKETGDYKAGVKLHREVTLEIPVTVTAEGGAEKSFKVEIAAETAAEATDEQEKVVEDSVENAGDEAESQ